MRIMTDISITSEPAQPPAKSTAPKTKKRKMNAAQRKALSVAAKERWAQKKAMAPYTVEGFIAPTPAQAIAPLPATPAPPSPSVLALQSQVVDLVSQRHQARTMLNECHNAYLLAQSRFQAAESELKGIEAEVQYRISLIAQLENRQPSNVVNITGATLTPEMVNSPNFGFTTGVSSEPSAPTQQRQPSQQQYATGSADDLRREIRGMM